MKSLTCEVGRQTNPSSWLLGKPQWRPEYDTMTISELLEYRNIRFCIYLLYIYMIPYSS
ncbi:MAG: hypothetical protein WAW59_02990 [Patescibacteria group bacterium]